ALLTRSGDYNLPLGQRAELARKHRADVFVSLHAGDGAHAEGGHAVLVHPAGPPSSWQLAQAVARELGRLGGRARPRLEAAPMAVLDPSRLGRTTAACLLELAWGGERYGDASWRDASRLEAVSD